MLLTLTGISCEPCPRLQYPDDLPSYLSQLAGWAGPLHQAAPHLEVAVDVHVFPLQQVTDAACCQLACLPPGVLVTQLLSNSMCREATGEVRPNAGEVWCRAWAQQARDACWARMWGSLLNGEPLAIGVCECAVHTLSLHRLVVRCSITCRPCTQLVLLCSARHTRT